MAAYFLKNPFKPAFELICFLNFYLCMLKKIPQKADTLLSSNLTRWSRHNSLKVEIPPLTVYKWRI